MKETSKSPHILNTSANLLGFCFIVLTSLHALQLAETSLIDEFALAAVFLFMTSSLLSFLSMRGNGRSEQYEKIADWFFLGGLLSIFITTLVVTFGIIR